MIIYCAVVVVGIGCGIGVEMSLFISTGMKGGGTALTNTTNNRINVIDIVVVGIGMVAMMVEVYVNR